MTRNPPNFVKKTFEIGLDELVKIAKDTYGSAMVDAQKYLFRYATGRLFVKGEPAATNLRDGTVVVVDATTKVIVGVKVDTNKMKETIVHDGIVSILRRY
uniref:Major capsid protein n=1 Tax=Caenorhabditis tropicalis TaxID=1561998 RepID=A0A1I7U1D1_9PELO